MRPLATTLSLWLTTVDRNQQFNKPMPVTLKAGNLRQKISRCHVCMRDVMSAVRQQRLLADAPIANNGGRLQSQNIRRHGFGING